MVAFHPAIFLSRALFLTTAVLFFVAAQDKNASVTPSLVTGNQSESGCAPEGSWNDAELNTYTIHLRIVEKDYVLHLTQNPLDKGVVVKNIKPDKYPLDKVLLNVKLDGDIIISLYSVEGEGVVSASTWTVNNETGIGEEDWKAVAEFHAPISDFANAFRRDHRRDIVYNRETCLKDDSSVAQLCNESCRAGSGWNCVHDEPLRWIYYVREQPRENLTTFLVSYGCNLQYERPVDIKNQKNQLIVFKLNANDKSNVDLSIAPLCYNVVGFFNQVIDRNWSQQGLTSCSSFPIKEFIGTKIPTKHETIKSDENNKMLVYIGIAVGVIVAFITLAGLYVYCCSDDEIDELLPPPGTAPEGGVTPGTTDGAPAPAAAT